MSRIWTHSLIEESKVRIAQSVDEWKSTGDDKLLASRILEAIAECNGASPQGRLDMYLLGMYGLITQKNLGVFSVLQVRQLTECITKALAVQRIDLGQSKLSYLYADYHALLGQLAIRSGNTWLATWQQHLAGRYLRDAKPEVINFHGYTLGQVLLRAGMIEQAKCQLQAVFQSESPAYRVSSGLNLLIIARIEQDQSQAKMIEAQLLQGPLTAAQTREINWEFACRQLELNDDPSELRRLINSPEIKDEPFFRVEACLWQITMSETHLPISKLDLDKARYRKELNLLSVGDLYEIAAAIQYVGEKDAAIEKRLERVGNMLESCVTLPSIHQERLAWKAAATQLKRYHFHAFAEVCRYKLGILLHR